MEGNNTKLAGIPTVIPLNMETNTLNKHAYTCMIIRGDIRLTYTVRGWIDPQWSSTF